MRRLIALAASIVLNAGLLGALQLNVYLAQTPPSGQVSITELTESSPPWYAQAAGTQAEGRPLHRTTVITR